MNERDVEGRYRCIRYRIERDPNGPTLRQDEGPIGYRTPNGFIWAHSLDELFFIPRVPHIPEYVTTWSRSMLKDLGENYEAIEEEMDWNPLVPPHVLRPWPVLKLPPGHPAQQDPPLGALDGRCEWEHSDFMCYALRPDGPDNNKHGVEAARHFVPKRCSTGPSSVCNGRVVLNNGSNPATDSDRVRYDYVWCEHFKTRLAGQSVAEREKLIALALMEMTPERAMADTDGVRLLPRPAWASGPGVSQPSGSKEPKEETNTTESVLPEGAEPSTVALPSPTPGSPKRTADADQADMPAGEVPSVSQDNADSVEETATTGANEGAGLPPHTNSSELAADKQEEANEEAGVAVPGEPAVSDEAGPDTHVFSDREQSSLEPSSMAAASTRKQKKRQNYKQKQAAKKAAGEINPFSTKKLPKLEEFIPDAFLPDTLLVHDPDRATHHAQAPTEPVRYRRIVFDKNGDGGRASEVEPGAEERVAHLHLLKANRLGTGHHSYVYRAPLTLTPPLSAYSRTRQVTVAAKLADPHCTAHALLHNEARTYSCFPRDIQEEYCGYNIIPPCRFPVPVGPVVPKCYGFYLPVNEDGEVIWKMHTRCNENEPCAVRWISPILLMEECGKPVEPEKFTTDQRTECFSLILRLHQLKITQGSFYVRNIMIQPGPLTLPPAMRTFDRPSFRIIDFGRARVQSRVGSVFAAIQHEQRQAREQLLIDMFSF